MKRRVAIMLALTLTMLVLTACGGVTPPGPTTTTNPDSPRFSSVAVDKNGEVTGKVLNGELDNLRIYVYLNGSDSDYDKIYYKPLIDGNDGRFKIMFTDSVAKSASVFLAPRNADISNRKSVENGSLDAFDISIDIPQPSPSASTPGTDFYITYDANGGDDDYGGGNISSIKTVKSHGVSVQLTNVVPLYDGHEFKGWSPDKNAEYSKYAPGAYYSADENVKLYAIWDPTITKTPIQSPTATPIPSPIATSVPSPIIDPSPSPTILPGFILMADDGAAGGENMYSDIGYMGTNYNDGRDDKSIGINVKDTSVTPVVGRSSMMFTYTPADPDAHWSGAALLWEPKNWKAHGPDLKQYTKMSFYVRGEGGKVKFFIEGEGYAQKTTYITLTDDWQEITLELGNWEYINLPWGWACNESDVDVKVDTLQFWVDGIHIY